MAEMVKICPRCKSAEVYIDKSNPLQPAMGMPARYICSNCGYSAPTFPEIDIEDLERLDSRKDLKNNKIKDKYGKQG